MANNPCLDLVQKSIPDMTGRELQEVIDLMQSNQATLMRSGMTADEAAKKASENVANTIRAAVKVQRRNAAMNKRVRLEGVDYLLANWQDDLTEGVLAMLYGSPKARLGSRNSAGAAQSANFRRYIGGLQKELEAEGLFDVVRRDEMEDDIAEALWNIDDEGILATLPSSAVRAARILEKWRETARLEANRHGAWIGKLKNYLFRQTNSPDRISKAGLERWKTGARENMDFDQMFPDGMPENLDVWLDEAFNNITTGVRPRHKTDATAERMSAFKGPKNLGKSLSSERVFIFKSAKHAMAYNREFGAGTLRESYINDLHRRAEATGLLQTLGTNPEYNLDAIIKAVRTTLSRTNPEALRKFDSKSRGGDTFDIALKELSGFTRTVASQNLANIGSIGRVWNVVSTLGNAVMAAVGDVPVKASLLRYQGQSFLGQVAKGLIDPVNRLLGGAGSVERRAAIYSLGHFNDVQLRNMVSRWSPDENVNGKLQSATNTYFKWNLLGQWTEEQRRGALESMGRFLGDMSERVWGELSKRTQRALRRFSITDKEWSVINKGVLLDDQGAKFLSPEKVREIPAIEFLELARNRIEFIQRGLLERVQKRMRADQREQGWIDSRHTKFTEALEKANERLLKLVDTRIGRAVTRRELLTVRAETTADKAEIRAGREQQQAFDKLVTEAVEANKTIGELTTDLEVLRDWFKMNFSFELNPAFGKRVLRQMGGQEETMRAALATAKREFNKQKNAFIAKMKKANDQVEGLRSRLLERADEDAEKFEKQTKGEIQARYDVFNEHWQARHKELLEYIKNLEERMDARQLDTKGDLDRLGGQVERTLDNVRTEMADRLQRFYADEVDSAVVTPDARTLAFTRRGTQAGTVMGEVLRAFWQFKSFPIGVIQRGFMREFYGYEFGAGGRFGTSEMQGLALLMVGTLVSGYASMTLKDGLRGRKPRPPDDWRTYRDAMVQGGSLGIFGDYMLGTQARFGGGFLSELGGPTVGRADDLYEMWGAVKNGDDVRAKALKFAISVTPYNNLFYTKAIADYLFLYNLQEAMNPGYLRRFERKIEEDTGAEWWLPPTEAVQ